MAKLPKVINRQLALEQIVAQRGNQVDKKALRERGFNSLLVYSEFKLACENGEDKEQAALDWIDLHRQAKANPSSFLPPKEASGIEADAKRGMVGLSFNENPGWFNCLEKEFPHGYQNSIALTYIHINASAFIPQRFNLAGYRVWLNKLANKCNNIELKQFIIRLQNNLTESYYNEIYKTGDNITFDNSIIFNKRYDITWNPQTTHRQYFENIKNNQKLIELENNLTTISQKLTAADDNLKQLNLNNSENEERLNEHKKNKKNLSEIFYITKLAPLSTTSKKYLSTINFQNLPAANVTVELKNSYERYCTAINLAYENALLHLSLEVAHSDLKCPKIIPELNHYYKLNLKSRWEKLNQPDSKNNTGINKENHIEKELTESEELLFSEMNISTLKLKPEFKPLKYWQIIEEFKTAVAKYKKDLADHSNINSLHRKSRVAKENLDKAKLEHDKLQLNKSKTMQEISQLKLEDFSNYKLHLKNSSTDDL